MAKRTIVEHTCDRCGVAIDEKQGFSKVAYGRIRYWLLGSMMEREICMPCRESFNKWWCEPKPEASTEKGEGCA